jgi:hypothetical protein
VDLLRNGAKADASSAERVLESLDRPVQKEAVWLTLFRRHRLRQQVVNRVTRNGYDDSRDGSPASFSRRLTSSQNRFDVMALPVSFHVRSFDAWNSGGRECPEN